MFKSQGEQVTVLGVCVDEPAQLEQSVGLDFCTVRSGRRAIDMLRILSFDLTLVGTRIPDINCWDFVRRVRTGWAWQKWALVAPELTPDQEISARSLGSIRIYDQMPSSDEILQLASRLRARATMSMPSRIDDRDQDGPAYRSASAF